MSSCNCTLLIPAFQSLSWTLVHWLDKIWHFEEKLQKCLHSITSLSGWVEALSNNCWSFRGNFRGNSSFLSYFKQKEQYVKIPIFKNFCRHLCCLLWYLQGVCINLHVLKAWFICFRMSTTDRLCLLTALEQVSKSLALYFCNVPVLFINSRRLGFLGLHCIKQSCLIGICKTEVEIHSFLLATSFSKVLELLLDSHI